MRPILLVLVFNYACKDFSCENFPPIDRVSEDEISLTNLVPRSLPERTRGKYTLCPIESYILLQCDFIRKFCLESFIWRVWINVSKAVKGKNKYGS